MSRCIEAVIIGNEILSGRRQDKHLQTTIKACEKRGLRLNAIHYLGDEPAQLIRIYKQTYANKSIVFSFGGIGATPDDRTRAAAAVALGRKLCLHPQGYALLKTKFADKFTKQRQQLINFPEGASLIPNPVNNVPGFSLFDHHFVPGFPSMATPMIAWVLDHYYSTLKQERQYLSLNALAPESTLIPLLQAMDNLFPDISISCLPQAHTDGNYRAELGFEGSIINTTTAKKYALDWLAKHNVIYENLP